MGYINDEKFKSLNELSSTISKMIMGLIKYLSDHEFGNLHHNDS